MKPAKGMIWKIQIKTKSGREEDFETDGHVGKYIKNFIRWWCKEILNDPFKEVVQRWQEGKKED